MFANWHTFKNGNVATRDESEQRMISDFFGALPPTVFVLMPIFALRLKTFYAFQRRLHGEHLIVALLSHAFLLLNLLLGILITMPATGVKPHAAWLVMPLGWMFWLCGWTPVYLLIMRKRVYRRSCPIAILKYPVLGWCYGWLLLSALVIAFVLGLAH